MFVFQNKDDILIQMEDYQSHVVCNADERDDREVTRKKIRDAIVACLNKFWSDRKHKHFGLLSKHELL